MLPSNRLPPAAHSADQSALDAFGVLRHEGRALAYYLVDDLDRAVLDIGAIHRERAAKNMRLHTGKLHVDELAGANGTGHPRRRKRYLIQTRTQLLVGKHAGFLVEVFRWAAITHVETLSL